MSPNNAQITAILYAPSASIAISSYTDVYGAIVGNFVNFASGHLHHDEHLKRVRTAYGTGQTGNATIELWKNIGRANL